MSAPLITAELALPEQALEALAARVAARIADAGGGADGPPAYTVTTLATALELSEKTVRGAIARGELAAVKRGGRYLIGRQAVEAWATPDPVSRRPRRASARSDRRPLSAAVATLARDEAGR